MNPYLRSLWIIAGVFALVAAFGLSHGSTDGKAVAGWAFGTAVLVAISCLVVGAVRWKSSK